MAKHTVEGKSKREIMRCLKRYAAREIYRQITGQIVGKTMPPGTSVFAESRRLKTISGIADAPKGVKLNMAVLI